jgi:hypothetical protein
VTGADGRISTRGGRRTRGRSPAELLFARRGRLS